MSLRVSSNLRAEKSGTNETLRERLAYTINAKANVKGMKKCLAGMALVWKT